MRLVLRQQADETAQAGGMKRESRLGLWMGAAFVVSLGRVRAVRRHARYAPIFAFAAATYGRLEDRYHHMKLQSVVKR
jgi:hypothetical protein